MSVSHLAPHQEGFGIAAGGSGRLNDPRWLSGVVPNL
jgi:hypothetical protein